MPSNSDDLSGGVSGAADAAGLDDPADRVGSLFVPSRNPWAWAVFTLYAVTVCVLHFEYGLEARLYWEVWWWDLMTHFASGVGVAAFASLLGLWRDQSLGRRVVFAAVTLTVVGAGFEVYERFFRTFWHDWTVSTYVEDTVVDVVVDALGGVAFVLARAAWIRRSE